MWELALPLTAAASGVAWAQLAARRAGERSAGLGVRALLGGAAAFGLAFVAYDASARAGFELVWERVARGDSIALLVAAAAGLIEEAAKLIGILLVLERRVRTRTVLAVTVGVAAGFSTFEALLVLGGEHGGVALTRAALAPAAHALLSVPIAFGVAAWLRGARREGVLLPALLASAALHAAGNVSLAVPWIGHAGYALCLAAPALLLFVMARRALRSIPPLQAIRPQEMERVRSMGGP